jgi:hypothetical protein
VQGMPWNACNFFGLDFCAASEIEPCRRTDSEKLTYEAVWYSLRSLDRSLLAFFVRRFPPITSKCNLSEVKLLVCGLLNVSVTTSTYQIR